VGRVADAAALDFGNERFGAFATVIFRGFLRLIFFVGVFFVLSSFFVVFSIRTAPMIQQQPPFVFFLLSLLYGARARTIAP
jgi:hypothetical protein